MSNPIPNNIYVLSLAFLMQKLVHNFLFGASCSQELKVWRNAF